MADGGGTRPSEALEDLALSEVVPSTTGVVAAVTSWRPHRTPKLTTSIVLWILGLYFALYAAAPVAITPERSAAFEAGLKQLEALDVPHARARDAVLDAQMDVSEAQDPWVLWRLDERKRRVVRARQAILAERRADLEVVERELEQKKGAALKELGIFSEAGVGEARRVFWRTYDDGKLFARRQSFYDALYALMAGRTEENVVEFVLAWAIRIIGNITVGMAGAVLVFLGRLPGLIRSFQPNFLEGVLFFIAAALGCVSVVITYLGAIYGTAAGGVYLLVKSASIQRRIESDRPPPPRPRAIDNRFHPYHRQGRDPYHQD